MKSAGSENSVFWCQYCYTACWQEDIEWEEHLNYPRFCRFETFIFVLVLFGVGIVLRLAATFITGANGRISVMREWNVSIKIWSLILTWSHVHCCSITNNKLLFCFQPNKIRKTVVNKALEENKCWGLHISLKSSGERNAK